MTDIEKLKALAKAATPGPWSWDDEDFGPPDLRRRVTLYAGRVATDSGIEGLGPIQTHGMNLFGRMEPDANGTNNFNYVCAVSPENVLEIITELADLRASHELSVALRNRIDALRSSHEKYTADMEVYNKRRDQEILALRAVRDAAEKGALSAAHTCKRPECCVWNSDDCTELVMALSRAKEVK